VATVGNLQTKLRAVLTAAIMLLVLGVSAAHAQVTVTAAWDRNTDAYTAGYRLYYGTASGNYTWSVDAGNQVTAPLNLSRGSRKARRPPRHPST
jgi:hypothetical protein